MNMNLNVMNASDYFRIITCVRLRYQMNNTRNDAIVTAPSCWILNLMNMNLNEINAFDFFRISICARFRHE